MRTICFILLLMICGGRMAFAEKWVRTSAPNLMWLTVASSADGSKLVALPGAKNPVPIYFSTNSGISWFTNSSAPGQIWGSLASSADGNTLVAAVASYLNTNLLYLSTNAGATWTLQTNGPSINSLACSADGKKWIATVLHNGIYTTTNAGATWTSNTVPSGLWTRVASSADGTQLMAAMTVNSVMYDYRLFASRDGGITWTQTSAPGLSWSSLTSSADGTRWAATASHTAYTLGGVYNSTDAGTNWTLSNSANNAWAAVASSADGGTLLAVAPWDQTAQVPVRINTSTNAGGSWTPDTSTGTTNYWEAVTTSADGGKSAAISTRDNSIWTLQTTPARKLKIAMSNGLRLSWTIPSTNLVVQQSSDFVHWSDVTNAPVTDLTNLQNDVALPMPPGSAFFRLQAR